MHNMMPPAPRLFSLELALSFSLALRKRKKEGICRFHASPSFFIIIIITQHTCLFSLEMLCIHNSLSHKQADDHIVIIVSSILYDACPL